jgi:hypothetical protein
VRGGPKDAAPCGYSVLLTTSELLWASPDAVRESDQPPERAPRRVALPPRLLTRLHDPWLPFDRLETDVHVMDEGVDEPLEVEPTSPAEIPS